MAWVALGELLLIIYLVVQQRRREDKLIARLQAPEREAVELMAAAAESKRELDRIAERKDPATVLRPAGELSAHQEEAAQRVAAVDEKLRERGIVPP